MTKSLWIRSKYWKGDNQLGYQSFSKSYDKTMICLYGGNNNDYFYNIKPNNAKGYTKYLGKYSDVNDAKKQIDNLYKLNKV